MKARRSFVAQGTATVGQNAHAGSRLLKHPSVHGGRNREEARALPSGSEAKQNGPWGSEGFGPDQPHGRFRLSDRDVGQCGSYDDSPAGRSVVDTRMQPSGLIESSGSSRRSDGLTESDVMNLNKVLKHEIAQSTIANYRVQWRNFVVWALARDIQVLPADPAQVAAYLAERNEEHGHKPATLRVAAAAIAFVHKTAEMNDPCASPKVKRTLRSAIRKEGRYQKQAQALTAEVLALIQSTAYKPRRGRGGRFESQETARSRGNLDIALIYLMRDAMLRVSEAAALTWKDIEAEPDGTGRLLIRRSKTDTEGQGAIAFISVATIAQLRLIQNERSDSDSVFDLRPNQISRRIKHAAEAAGLGRGFSGHSPRVGMARDLARAGIELPSLMNAGRWRSPAMPAHYTRNETAGKGAVAQFYGYRRRET